MKDNYLVIIIFIIFIFLGYFYLFGEFRKEYISAKKFNNIFEKVCQTDEMKTSKECQDYFVNRLYKTKERLINYTEKRWRF